MNRRTLRNRGSFLFDFLTCFLNIEEQHIANIMASTADCKKFIVDFIEANASVVTSIYFDGSGTDEDEIFNPRLLLKDAPNPKKKNRIYKCKPGGGIHEFDEYAVFSRDVKVKRMGYGGTTPFDAQNVVSERGFCLVCDPYENGVQFVIIEDTLGNLYFATTSETENVISFIFGR